MEVNDVGIRLQVVGGLTSKVRDVILEVGDLKLEVGELRSPGIPLI